MLDLVMNFFSVLAAAYIGWKLNERRLRKQEFESNLFKLLETQDDIRNNIHIEFKISPDKTYTYNGKEFFSWGMTYTKELYTYQKTFNNDKKNAMTRNLFDLKNKQFLFEFYENSIGQSKFYEGKLDNQDVKLKMATYTYASFFNLYFNELGHYFRHLFRILKYIKRHEKHLKKFGDVDFYYGIIQARMSAAELYFLFYDGLLFPKMKTYIDDHKLVENLAIEDLMDTDHHNFYRKQMKSRKEITQQLKIVQVH